MARCGVDPTHPVISEAGGPDFWDPKGLRERLCKQQSHAPSRFTQDLITRLIHDVDRHRPLGSDGKHGELHTDSCGCDLS